MDGKYFFERRENMTTKINSEEISKLLNTWYIHMRSNEFSKAVALKLDLDKKIKDRGENEDILLHYSLLDLRHKILLKQFRGTDILLEKIEPLKCNMSDRLTYYYHFFKGMYAYSIKNYEEAIEQYIQAEKRLDKVDDEIEKAEFHYKVASAYYYLDQNLVSSHHVKKALSIFERHEGYQKRTADSLMLLGLNLIDVKQFVEAEGLFHSGLDIAKKLDDKALQARFNHNLGLLYFEQTLLETAVTYLSNVILTEEHERQVYSLQSMYLLAHALFRLENTSEARDWFIKGVALANQLVDKDYIMKFRLLSALYMQQEELESIFQESIAYFEDNKMWKAVEDNAEIFAAFYKDQADYEKSCGYFEMAVSARQKNFEKERLR
jgi:tetratricopeptide (TPR) repeat protein